MYDHDYDDLCDEIDVITGLDKLGLGCYMDDISIVGPFWGDIYTTEEAEFEPYDIVLSKCVYAVLKEKKIVLESGYELKNWEEYSEDEEVMEKFEKVVTEISETRSVWDESKTQDLLKWNSVNHDVNHNNYKTHLEYKDDLQSLNDMEESFGKNNKRRI